MHSRSTMPRYDVTDSDDDEDGCGGRCRRCCTSCRDRKCCSPHAPQALHIVLLLLAIGAGIGLGIYLRTTPTFATPTPKPRPLWYLTFPGRLLERAARLLWAPVVVSGVVSGVARLGRVGRVGARALLFYLATTTLACLEGLAFGYILRPGSANDTILTLEVNGTLPEVNKIDVALDHIRNLIPDDILLPLYQTDITKRDWQHKYISSSNSTHEQTEVLSVAHKAGVNLLGLTLISILVGLTIAKLGDKARPVADFSHALSEVVMAIVRLFLWLVPLGVVFLVAEAVILLPDDFLQQMTLWWRLLLALGSALACHSLLVLPLLLVVLTRTNPFRQLAGMSRAFLTALATQNSVLTLPVTIDCLESECGLDRGLVRGLVPLAAAVGADSTALCGTAGVVVLAGLRGVSPGAAGVATLGAVALVMSIFAPIPGNAVIVWSILMECVGLPPEYALLLLPFEWLLGRLCAVVDVWADAVGINIVCHFSRPDLHPDPPGVAAADDSDSEESVGMVMNGSYRPIDSTPSRRKSYTLTVENENGDIVKVSKV